MIYLVNAGCRQAGPKILFDRSMRVSDCCIDLRNGLGVPRAGTASSRSNLERPPGLWWPVGSLLQPLPNHTEFIIQGRESFPDVTARTTAFVGKGLPTYNRVAW